MDSELVSFDIVQQMDGQVDELHHLCKVVTILRSHDGVPDQPVQDHGDTCRLELVTADEVRDVLHRDQAPLRHLSVIVGGGEGLRKLEVEHILSARNNAATNTTSRVSV